MAAVHNGHPNGAATNGNVEIPVSTRFSDIPSAIDIPVQGDQEDEASHRAKIDRHDDCSCSLFPGIVDLFDHMRRGIIAAHAECGLQKADDGSVGPT